MSQGPSPSEFLTFYRRITTHPAIRQTVARPTQTSTRLRAYSTSQQAAQPAPVTRETATKVEKLNPLLNARFEQPALPKAGGQSVTKSLKSVR